ncbi:MAG: Rieske (2Fe-2S) protein [Planctomycetaceae bacterium]
MPNWITVAQLEEIPAGTGKEVVADGQIIAVFNIDGHIHAMDGICPHAGGPVGTGKVEGCVVTCPWHGWQFDVTTGQHMLSPTLSHPTFPARVVDDSVQIQLQT